MAASTPITHHHDLWVDHDYKTQGGGILRITAIIRGSGGAVEYCNLSHPDKPIKRVERQLFQQIAVKHLGRKGSEA